MAGKLGKTRPEAEGESESEKKHMREAPDAEEFPRGMKGRRTIDTACLELVAAKGMGEVFIGLFGGDGVEVTKDGGFRGGFDCACGTFDFLDSYLPPPLLHSTVSSRHKSF